MPAWEIFLIVIGCIVGAYVAFVILMQILALIIVVVASVALYFKDKMTIARANDRWKNL
jgi:uncharacterized membrane protein